MRSTILATVICCLLSLTTHAQSNYAVKGIVSDTASTIKLDKATVNVLNAKDSILQKFVYTNQGIFNINNLKPGKFQLLVTYPDYADFVETFTLDSIHPVHDFTQIGMVLKSKLLNEVLIKAKPVAIKIKGDTTEFNAAAYATQKNAKVEDLLKQLQGMKIDQSGKITFQGQEVKKILVDGEEFFGDDPALVTKNIRADMVNKIQVYDQKSEKAKLTGVDDGQKIKTINVQLSEDKKTGVFGKVEADYGTGKYYTGQAMVNKFSPKQKIAAYGNLSSAGNVGLSGGDAGKFSGGSVGPGYDGVGLPLARDGGATYSNKWNKDKESINTSYTLGSLTIDGEGSTFTQNNLPGNFNTSNQTRDFHKYNSWQSFNADYSAKLDTTSDLRAQVSFYGSDNSSNNTTNTTTLRGNGVLLNSNENNSTSSSNNKWFYSSANYTKRFKKKGRSIAAYGSVSNGKSNSDNYLKSSLKYYNEQGISDSTATIDQYKPGAVKYNELYTGISYTEPLAKTISFNAGYAFSYNRSDNEKGSFNKSTADMYDVPDPAFSSNFNVQNVSNVYSSGLSYSKDKVYFGINGNVTGVNFKQTDKFLDTALTRNFTNWQTNSYFSYQLSKAASINFNYSGDTRQPSIDQLQPLRQNADPLNITIGNPGLRPSFTNNFSGSYRLYQATLDRGINLNGSYSNTLNPLINNRRTDSAGVNTYQWQNLKGKQPVNWNIYSEVYGHIPKVDAILSLSFSVNGSTFFNYINAQLNQTRSMVYTPSLSIWKNKTTYSYYFNFAPNYVVNSTTLQQVNNNSHGYSSGAGFYVKLPLNFFIGSDVNYIYNAKNQVFDRDFRRTLLKSYFGKTFLKDETLKLSVTGNDLLNQNTGYSRNGTTDSFTENRNTTIRRYIMFALTWDFSKFGKTAQKK